MIGLFWASVLAGAIASAPFGVVGALVADAALMHDGKRLIPTVLAAVTGDMILSFLISFASSPVRDFLQKYEGVFFVIAGTAVMLLGIYLWTVANVSHLKVGRVAGPVSVFFVTLTHPIGIGAFLLITALFSINFPAFKDHRALFACGIASGSFLVVGPMGALFWMLREKAGKFVRQSRCGLAGVIVLMGVYLLVKSF